jgi:hypothetical protein
LSHDINFKSLKTQFKNQVLVHVYTQYNLRMHS